MFVIVLAFARNSGKTSYPASTRNEHEPRKTAHAVGLDRSGAAEADGDLARFDDDRNLALVVGEGQHPLEPLGILQDVDVLEGYVSLRVVLTGTPRVGSEILPEDQNLFRHRVAS